MPACEHCQVDPAAIKAEIQRGADARIKELTERNAALRAEANGHAERAKSAEAKLGELQAEREALALAAVEAEAGWNFDERGRKAARWSYEETVSALPEGERPSFTDWLRSEAATGDVLLGAFRKVEQPSSQGAQRQPAPRLPASTGTRQVETPPVQTLEQRNAKAAEIMRSPLPIAEKQAALAALKAAGTSSPA